MDYVVGGLAAAVILLAAGLALVLTKRPPGQTAADSGELLARMDRQDQTLADLRSIANLGDRGQDMIREELTRASRSLAVLQAETEARKHFEEDNRQVIKRLEGIIAGSYSKGRAGENILREAFKVFPPSMLETNYQVGGKVVEFGLRLFDGKVLPIDSKWPSTMLVMALEEETDQAKRLALINEIEKEVTKKVREAASYIDPDRTVPWAVAAIPDSVFSICQRTFLDAYRARVILISYSMAIPYALTFYSLHLQYARSVDAQNIHAHLLDIERHLNDAEVTLENRIAKGNTMISNAYAELSQMIAKVRGAITYMRSLEKGAEALPDDAKMHNPLQ